MSRQLCFFDLEDRYAAFSSFRYRLDKALKRSDLAKGGRPPFYSVLLFKVLVLQTLSTLSDAKLLDRLAEAVSRTYKAADISLSLLETNRIAAPSL